MTLQLLYFRSFWICIQDKMWLHPGMNAFQNPSLLQNMSNEVVSYIRFFFNVYMDELIHKSEMNNVGCYIGRHFTGPFCYADDFTRLSPRKRELRKNPHVCDFVNEYSVKFNGSKTLCVRFYSKAEIYLCSLLGKIILSNHVKLLENKFFF